MIRAYFAVIRPQFQVHDSIRRRGFTQQSLAA
jgi:hypothetical protein